MTESWYAIILKFFSENIMRHKLSRLQFARNPSIAVPERVLALLPRTVPSFHDRAPKLAKEPDCQSLYFNKLICVDVPVI